MIPFSLSLSPSGAARRGGPIPVVNNTKAGVQDLDFPPFLAVALDETLDAFVSISFEGLPTPHHECTSHPRDDKLATHHKVKLTVEKMVPFDDYLGSATITGKVPKPNICITTTSTTIRPGNLIRDMVATKVMFELDTSPGVLVSVSFSTSMTRLAASLCFTFSLFTSVPHPKQASDLLPPSAPPPTGAYCPCTFAYGDAEIVHRFVRHANDVQLDEGVHKIVGRRQQKPPTADVYGGREAGQADGGRWAPTVWCFTSLRITTMVVVMVSLLTGLAVVLFLISASAAVRRGLGLITVAMPRVVDVRGQVNGTFFVTFHITSQVPRMCVHVPTIGRPPTASQAHGVVRERSPDALGHECHEYRDH
ncbi:hypothetical protein NM208_g8769 [Fusarium decemcellulare]|uniref:Uncharacterized protein n=1 Tax=Fusarium decemcellulare TaxID=57161 RepID=A0ACC1S448_9HYPO|nr:hypothetical protein NM208_g8769 [Fusarium decemcellulare]